MNNLPLLSTIAAAFAAAWVLGLISQRLGLSPIVGYLLAGVVIGPHTPGFVGDIHLAGQLAEIGVILLMFGVGLHFHLKDLLAVKSIAIPGAVGQSVVATVCTVAAFHFFGWPVQSGLVLGMAMAVASTVVLLRGLMSRDMLNTPHGHAAVGWLIVEDMFTVLVLVLIPILGTPDTPTAHPGSGLASLGWAVAKLAALIAIVLLAGSRVVPWVLASVAKLRSRELFTLTVLVLSVAIAVGSAALFGASVALGAFLAGMVVAQSPVSHQAAADALPLRDAFAVLFFVAVGMLFDPSFLLEQPWMVACGLAIVLVAKPLAALVIVAAVGYPVRTAITVAIGLSQIGEFSFILAQVSREHNLMTEDGQHLLVAIAMISITINPLLFSSMDRIESMLRRRPLAWRLLNARSRQRADDINRVSAERIAEVSRPLAIIVGYGPVGRVVDALLRDAQISTVIIDMNMETVNTIVRSGHAAIYGDASLPAILDQAGVRKAAHLVLTLPHSSHSAGLILAAREMNPAIEITVRARYLRERDALEAAGASWIVYEEGEAGIALARRVLERRGVDRPTIQRMLDSLRQLWRISD